MSGRFEWDQKEVVGGYDHDGERTKLRKIKEAEYAPVGADTSLPVLGKCVVCARPAVHTWPRPFEDGAAVLICSKHWSKALSRRAQDLAAHPEAYVVEEEAPGKRRGLRRPQGPVANRRRVKPVPDDRRTESRYGAKGDANWERRAGQ